MVTPTAGAVVLVPFPFFRSVAVDPVEKEEGRADRNMIRELDTVVLTRDIGEYGLKRGDVGAVVHCYPDGMAFEVEFVTAEGKTVALLTLTRADVRRMADSEILHVRKLAGAGR